MRVFFLVLRVNKASASITSGDRNECAGLAFAQCGSAQFSKKEFQMTAGDRYRIRAAKFEAQAKKLTTPTTHQGFLSLARSYVRLAELADRNEHTDIYYEVPERPSRQS